MATGNILQLLIAIVTFQLFVSELVILVILIIGEMSNTEYAW